MQNGLIRPHGRWWMLQYREDAIHDGKRIRKLRYKKLAPIDRDHQPKRDGSAPEKVRALAVLELAPLNAGLREPHSSNSLKAFLESFLATGEGGRGRMLNPTTQKSYKVMFAIAKDFLPDIELGRVRTQHIDKLLQDVAKADGPERRAQTAYANLKNFLASAFRYASRKGLTEISPVRDAAIPQGNPADTHAYSLTEVHAILQNLPDRLSRSLVVVAAFTGLRTEEIKGLRWEDYDGKVLNIRRAVVYGKEVSVKTDASKAPVPVVDTVRKVLEDQRKRGSGSGYIFSGDTGKPLVVENYVRRSIKPTLSKAKVGWHGMHAFRRGLGTYLEVKLKLPREAVKRILRHSVVDVTGQHYIKTSVEENRKALERVEADFLKLKPRVKL
jgi:integrase